MRIPARAPAASAVYGPSLSRPDRDSRVLMTLVRNLPPNAVACWEGGVALKSSLSALGLKTVLIAGRPIWSPARHVFPSFQVVVAQTPMVSGSSESGIDRTMAFVLRAAKKSVGSLPSVSPPTAVPV